MNDTYSLFVDYVDAGEGIGEMELMQERRNKWKYENNNQMTLKSRSQLLQEYRLDNGEPDVETVDGIIARKTADELYESDPDVAGRKKYYVHSETTFT